MLLLLNRIQTIIFLNKTIGAILLKRQKIWDKTKKLNKNISKDTLKKDTLLKIINQMHMDNFFTIAGFLEISQTTNKKVTNNFKVQRNIKTTSVFINNTLTQVTTIKEPLIHKTNNFIKSILQLKASNTEFIRHNKKIFNLKKRAKRI